MKSFVSCILTISLFLSTFGVAFGQQSLNANPTKTTVNNDDDEKKKDEKKKDDKEKVEGKIEINDPLVKILLSKGLINQAEANGLANSNVPIEQRNLLANLLMQKGLITSSELEAIRSTSPKEVAANAQDKSTFQTPATMSNANATSQPSNSQATAAQTKPAVIPAIAPLRVLQIEGAKRDGLIPDIKLGSGAKLKLYGFFKTSAVWDSSNPSGNDFPLPGFLGDSGPNGSPTFHLKARAFRFGANFEWLDMSPKTTLTGKVEVDFEGDFTRAANRNISSIRSSQPSLRLAFVRLDRVINENTSAHVLIGQDWTPFGSSTMPNAVETTGFHLAYGNIYERAPQVRFGINYLLSKKRNLLFMPEIAMVLPMFGNTPSDTGNQLGLGERQGPDSNRPEFQGRFVLQWQLDKATGVAPAQLITSWTEGRRKAIVLAANVPGGLFKQAFPNGVELVSRRYGYTGEFQLPTRWFTLIGKAYEGADLRSYFGGQLYSTFNDTAGMTFTNNVTSIDGSSTVVFGIKDGVVTVARQAPVRGYGGFINLGLPLSRWFNADPKGRNAGWSAYLHYGIDAAFARDARRLGIGRGKSDVFMTNIQYKLNSFVTFAWEESYFRTRAVNNAGSTLPLFRGIPSRSTHNIRTEFATIFTF
jgi:hypothetical protein